MKQPFQWATITAIAMLSHTAVAQSIQPRPALGQAVQLDPNQFEKQAGPAAAAQGPASGLSVNIQDRTDVLAFYHEVYQASEGYAQRISWTGHIGSCLPGTVAPEFQDDTLRRINYFRAMTGLPADITFDPTKNTKAQAAALIYAANQVLTHFPIRDLPNGACLSPEGDEGGQNSNIALGSFGPDSVNAYIRDDGLNNAAVGHRRWLLYPRATVMGEGSVPPGMHGLAANAVWVIGNFGARPAHPPWVSWPPPGYVPYLLIYERWSFSYPAADFSAASVTMTCDGNPVTLALEPVSNGFGDNTLVWTPAGLDTTAPDPDRTYVVTLQNVSVSGSPRSFTYNVVAMDPFNLAQTITLQGPAQPYLDTDNTYTFNPIPQASEYQLRSARAVSTPWTEGAESSPSPRIVDGTTGGYSLYTTALSQTGARSFHLAFASFEDNDQTVVIDRAIVPGAASELRYASRFRFAGTTSRLSAEISTDNGARWTALGSRAGNGATSSSGWESSWISSAMPLGAYAGQTVTLRLRYHYEPFTSVFIGTGDNYGFFIDNITVTGAQELTDTALTSIPGGSSSLAFNPSELGQYYLQLQPMVAGLWFGFGPALVVQAQPAPPSVRITQIAITNASTLVIDFAVLNPTSASFHLLGASAPTGFYAPEAATFETLQAGAAYRARATRAIGGRYYRISMD